MPLKVLVTSGPTVEKIDPIRYISNNSSGKQGHAIACELAKQGCDVTLISGPVSLEDPNNVNVVKVQSADDMLQAVREVVDNEEVDVAVCVAAVCDWKVKGFLSRKIKKSQDEDELNLTFIKNPDILKYISQSTNRPKLVVGFAAETENLIENAKKKILVKGCDWIIANEVNSKDNVFNSEQNKICVVSEDVVEEWERMNKTTIAQKLAGKIVRAVKN